MSLIRTITKLTKNTTSRVYAYEDVDGYFYVTVVPGKRREIKEEKHGFHGVKLTKREMKHIVQQAKEQYGW